MNVSATVSVIIPAFNAAPYVADAVTSVLSQTTPPLEVIVVDDGSTDDTASVLKRFSGVITVISQRNSGLSAARNAGASVAIGTILAFLDADDIWLPGKLERQIPSIHADVAMSYTDRINVGTRGDLPERQSDIQPLHAGDIFQDLLARGNFITASSVIIRADVFRELGGFDVADRSLDPASDWDLWIRVAATHSVAVCPEALVKYRFHDGNMSGDAHRMQRARTIVVSRALRSPRGRQLTTIARRRVLAVTSNYNAMGAARRGQTWLACREYLRALTAWPFYGATYYDIGRTIFRRW